MSRARPRHRAAENFNFILIQSEWFRDSCIALVAGIVATCLGIGIQYDLDNKRFDREQIQENLRFIRERSQEENIPRPFRSMDLSDQNISGLILSKADLTDAIFVNADLTGTDLTGARISGANFTNATMKDAKIETWDMFGTNFTNVDLSGITLNAETGAKAIYTRTKLREATMISFHFSKDDNGLQIADPDMTRIDLTRSHVNDLDLRERNFSGATLREVDFSGTNLTGIDLRRSYEPEEDPKSADLTDAILEDTIIESACYDYYTIWPSGFTPPPNVCPEG